MRQQFLNSIVHGRLKSCWGNSKITKLYFNVKCKQSLTLCVFFYLAQFYGNQNRRETMDFALIEAEEQNCVLCGVNLEIDPVNLL
jgi:hypothetical protein